MVLVATMIENGTALAIYAERPMTIAEVWEAATVYDDGRVFFGPEIRVTTVSDEPAPAVQPADLSEPLNGG